MKNKFLTKTCIFILFSLICSFTMQAQTFSVSGSVTDDSGGPLEGATVSEKGTKTAVLTNHDGLFQLNVSSGKATLVISYVGHATQEIAIDNKAQLSAVLKTINDNLSDVVVVGYGTVKRK